MTSINTNIGALRAQSNMLDNSKDLDQAMARISSGNRINSAADDAAGSAIASKIVFISKTNHIHKRSHCYLKKNIFVNI